MAIYAAVCIDVNLQVYEGISGCFKSLRVVLIHVKVCV